MASPAIDYDALAKQYGAVSSTPTGAAPVDYDALAKQHGATSSTAAPSFTQQFIDATRDRLKDLGSAVYGTAANANRMFANVAEMGENVVRNTAGIEAAAPLRNLGSTFRQNQEAQQAEAQRLAGGRNDLAGQITRGLTQGVLELPQYAVAAHLAGPVAGMAAIGGITEADKGWLAAMQAAAEGALTGGALHVMGPASQAIRGFGAAGMTYLQARLNGADPETALAHATTMGIFAGHAPGGATAREFVPGLDTAITTGERVGEATRAGARAAAPDVGMGAAKAGAGYLAGEAAGMVPGGGFVKHILDIPTAYIGARQIGRGLKKGAGAFRASMAETAPPETTAAEPAATGPGPAGAPTDDAILHLYSVETDPAKRAALRTELIDRGLMNDPDAPPAPGENPYRGYTQTALRNVYEIEPDPAKRALIEQAAQSRGLSLLNREGRRATAAPPETAAEERGPSLTQDDVLLLRYLGEENPQNADADTIGIARQLAAEKPGLLDRLRRGEPEPVVPPVTAEEAAAPAVQSLGTLEYTAPGVPPAAPAATAAPAAAAPEAAAPEAAPAEAAPPAKPAAADIAAQLEASMRTEALTDYIVRTKIPPHIVGNFGDAHWATIAREAGVEPPTPENIAQVLDNLAQHEAAQNITATTAPNSPAEAAAEFQQNRALRNPGEEPPAAAAPEPAPPPQPETPPAGAAAPKHAIDVPGSADRPASKWMTEDGLRDYAAENKLTEDAARTALTESGYKIRGRRMLNSAIHALGGELGLDHELLRETASITYGVKSLTQLTQDQMLEMYNHLAERQAAAAPLVKKTAPVDALAEKLKVLEGMPGAARYIEQLRADAAAAPEAAPAVAAETASPQTLRDLMQTAEKPAAAPRKRRAKTTR
jgi:hypothetical protein